MMGLEGRLAARRNAPLHVQLELVKFPVPPPMPCVAQIEGQIVRVFRGGATQSGASVRFPLWVCESGDEPTGSAYVHYRDLTAASHMEAYLYGTPPYCELAAYEFVLLNGPSPEARMSAGELEKEFIALELPSWPVSHPKMAAKGTNWKRQPFKGGVPVSCSMSLTVDEFERVQAGFIPRDMEDKWFIYYEAPFLFCHRSWTGRPVYRLKWAVNETRATLEEALWSDDLAGRSGEDEAYQALLIDFLISNLLLGQGKPFPRPAGIRDLLPGVYQHHISGTGYRERLVRTTKPWWKLW